MREFLKELRKLENEKLIERLNYNQKKYNKYFDLMYKYNCKDESTRHTLDVTKDNMDKIKKVFNERNIKIAFINGWKLI